LFERSLKNKSALFVSDVVVWEAGWVLLSVYRLPRSEVAEAIGRLLQASNLVFQDEGLLGRALDSFVSGKADFADYGLQHHAEAAGCTAVVTFDRALLKEKGFALPA
jgi:predicted nucleic-acid-binding protein